MSIQLNYEQRAQRHRPSDPARVRAEIVRLMGQGLSTRDVATALRLDVPAVLNLLAGEGTTCGP